LSLSFRCRDNKFTNRKVKMLVLEKRYLSKVVNLLKNFVVNQELSPRNGSSESERPAVWSEYSLETNCRVQMAGVVGEIGKSILKRVREIHSNNPSACNRDSLALSTSDRSKASQFVTTHPEEGVESSWARVINQNGLSSSSWSVNKRSHGQVEISIWRCVLLSAN